MKSHQQRAALNKLGTLFILFILFSQCTSVKDKSILKDDKESVFEENILVRFNIKSDSIRFDNLRFFKVFASSKPGGKYERYIVEKTWFSFDEKSTSSIGGKVGKILTDQIFNSKSKVVSVDSVLLRKVGDNKFFNKKVDFKFRVVYPQEYKFECLDDKDHYNFKELVKVDGTVINVLLDENRCKVLEFNNLGSLSVVNISSNGKSVFNQEIKNGYRDIDYFFNFSNFKMLDIKITGDYNWKGEINIVDSIPSDKN